MYVTIVLGYDSAGLQIIVEPWGVESRDRKAQSDTATGIGRSRVTATSEARYNSHTSALPTSSPYFLPHPLTDSVWTREQFVPDRRAARWP